MKIKFFITLILSIAFNGQNFSLSGNTIKDPKPNMFEKDYMELVKVKEVGDDLGGDNFLFHPYSMDTDGKYIYVYDNFQAKILKFDSDLNFIKSGGRKGPGPGEFSGTGRGYGVTIKVGKDGRLYLNDYRRVRVYIYSKDLEYIDTYKCPLKNFTSKNPMTDSKNNYYHLTFKNRDIRILKNGKPFFLIKDKYNFLDFLFASPKDKSFDDDSGYYNSIFSAIIDDSTFLLLSKRSSILLISNGSNVKSYKIWPKKALFLYKNEIDLIPEEKRFGYLPAIRKAFRDKNGEKALYLFFGRDIEKKQYLLYKVNLEGKLLKVYFVKYYDPKSSYIKFMTKIGDRFFARQEDKIIIYKKK